MNASSNSIIILNNPTKKSSYLSDNFITLKFKYSVDNFSSLLIFIFIKNQLLALLNISTRTSSIRTIWQGRQIKYLKISPQLENRTYSNSYSEMISITSREVIIESQTNYSKSKNFWISIRTSNWTAKGS